MVNMTDSILTDADRRKIQPKLVFCTRIIPVSHMSISAPSFRESIWHSQTLFCVHNEELSTVKYYLFKLKLANQTTKIGATTEKSFERKTKTGKKIILMKYHTHTHCL